MIEGTVNRQHASEIREVVAAAAPELRCLTDAEVSAPRVPGGWSKLEILGHLIDSACNNHQRFVRAQQVEELSFPSYDQNAWVACQQYGSAEWSTLVDLWVAYNAHLAYVLECMPPEQLATPCHMDRETPSGAIPLSDVIEGYVTHMRHHVAQLTG